ncbi:putative quinone-oxidoreductase homolog chloroplastic [Phtheirospermum japonicum]|uniref:Putative quinone-oxidoreductase homolog chloroplastic n=1 Tax=Phtheirospermum japonicum TaxID=374723 RepID=A0A830CV85_9LAMI|nr:putative quinone-oxidoreductase homolog chloroplastic [Phtheirospermum japonicum]
MSMAGKLMHAVQYGGYGRGAAGLKHVEVQVPSPSKGEVLIKFEAISLNQIDWKIQGGMVRPFLPRKFPFIPATDVSGEAGGGLAEYGVASEKLTVHRPPEVSAAECAGLPIAGLTAHMALTQSFGMKLDKSGPHKNILITAASGGVGQYAVQLAKLGNAHVTATCGARNVGFVKSLGADEVIDYRTPEGAALKSPSGKKYDAVVHCAPALPWSVFKQNLSTNGIVIDITPGPWAMWTSVMTKLTCSKKRMVPLLVEVKDENLRYLVELVRDGKLKTVIDSKFPLAKAEEAWAKSIEGHATGKIIVKP